MHLSGFRRDEPLERVLGACQGRASGPLVIAIAGIHGNEPAGVVALRRVLRELVPHAQTLRGRFVALTGNRAGLARGVRGVDHDLNRYWTRASIAEARSKAPEARDTEQKELVELAEALEREFARAPGPVTLLDLHSTSGPTPPFTLHADELRAVELARALDVAALFGLEMLLGSTLVDWTHKLGHTGLVIEGGQNEAEDTADHHESALWIALAHAGVLDANALPDLAAHRARLTRAAGPTPRALTICHRHVIPEGERFEMLPGWSGFDPVREGDMLARGGPTLEQELRAPYDATLIMPRYQGAGSDGFFLARANPR
ncbi:MAG: succinylglutamate desuccinylase/aspartoacylase family protein [Planctomycetes bacterium]|nr:succinylglutamate desuccinylase/aspartoacylase family protein [Planctomycetota bacterium]